MLTHILPLTLDEFKAWMLQGELRLPAMRLIAMATSEDSTLNADQSVAEAIAVLLPDFQEEHEVLLAQVNAGPQLEWASLAPAIIHLDFANVRAIYPITSRATEQLARRLAGMRLSAAPFSDRLIQEGLHRLKRHLLLGGRAMLRLVKQDKYQEHFEKMYGDIVWAASNARDEELSWPESAKNLWFSLFLYERRNSGNRYPDTDAGFLFDIAAQFKSTAFGLGNEERKADMTRVLRALSDFLTPLARDTRPLSGPILQEAWALFAPLFSLLERSSPPAAAVFLFFLLRDELRRNAAPDWQILRSRLHNYFPTMPTEDFALGVWLAGVFFGVRELATLVQTNTHELFGAGRPVAPTKAVPALATIEVSSVKSPETAKVTTQVYTGLDLIRDSAPVSTEDYRESVDLSITPHAPSSQEVPSDTVGDLSTLIPISSSSSKAQSKPDTKSKSSRKELTEISDTPKPKGRPPGKGKKVVSPPTASTDRNFEC